MGRRKQANPTKRNVEEEEEIAEDEPKAKTKNVEAAYEAIPSTSSQPAKTVITPTPATTNSSQKYNAIPSTSAATATSSDAATSNPLLLLEKSLKKFAPSLPKPRIQQQANAASTPSSPSPSNVAGNNNNNGLCSLFQFVNKLSTDSFSITNNPRPEAGVDSILKCLQCSRAFHTMELLVKHMQETKHFDNLPKSYSNLVQLDRQRVLNLKLQMKSEGLKLACVRCGEIPPNIDKHLKESHDVKSSAEWLRNVRTIRPGEERAFLASMKAPKSLVNANSTHLNNLMSLINTVDKQ